MCNFVRANSYLQPRRRKRGAGVPDRGKAKFKNGRRGSVRPDAAMSAMSLTSPHRGYSVGFAECRELLG